MKKSSMALLAIPLVAAVFLTAGEELRHAMETLFLRVEKDNSKPLRATGIVEMQTVHIASKLSGTIEKLFVSEGMHLSPGDPVARLSRPDLAAQVQRDKAALAKARALLEDLLQGTRPEEIAQAKASVDAAQSRFDKAKSDYARFERLHKEQVIADKQFDEYQNTLRVAQSDLAAARERYALTVAGPRTKQIEAARHEVDLLSAALATSRSILADTHIVSPVAGVVLSKGFEEGEFVLPGGVVAEVGRYEDCWIRLYIPSTLLGRISLGGTAEVRVDSFPERIFPGFVSEIAQEAEFTPRMSLHPDERANLVFRVKVSVPNEDGALKSGMPADVVFP
ncbi:HlyD family secretion protein [Aminiphilus circumscriptus]|uniref:HlyD family secretion protein n=1 Tax=Aminiphilus circumscriptus TaxID=290732 RepID=UPI0004928EC0|nr:efflux RND transporter periplasmic adaptor subunit [Aminiphilus circumscriptus]